MEQALYSLPDGWKWLPFGDLIDLIQNGINGTQNDEKIGVPVSRIETLQNNNLDIKRIKHIEATDSDIKKYKYQDGDLIFSHINSFEKVGKIALYKNQIPNLIHGVNLLRIRLVTDVNPRFIYFYIQSPVFRRLLEPNIKRAINQASINQKNLSNILVPFCESSREQKRIVEKLDALLTRIDTAIEHLQSKLDLSKQLFNSVLDEFFKLSDCDSVPLTEVVDFIGGSQPPKSQFSDDQKEGYVRLIQIRDYKSGNHIVYVDSASTKKFCTKDDVMIGRYGPPVFQILRGLDGAYNVALMKAVPNEDVLTKDYLFWFLQSPSIQNYVIGISQRAAGQSGVNKKALEKYLIPVPNKAIQNDIVDKVGQLVNKSRNLESEVTAEITSLNQLKASILDSAFKGEL